MTEGQGCGPAPPRKRTGDVRTGDARPLFTPFAGIGGLLQVDASQRFDDLFRLNAADLECFGVDRV